MIEREFQPDPSRPSDLNKLQKFEKTRGKLRLPPDIKPCLATLMDGSHPQIRHGKNPFIVACELYRIGKTEDQIVSLLLDLGVNRSKVYSAVSSAIKGKYGYGCPTLEFEGLCLYKLKYDCPWYDQIPRQNQKAYRNRDFWRFGWPERLGPAASMIYLAIIEIEKKRRIWAGSSLFISYRELSKTSGLSIGWILKGLNKLIKHKLIKFKVGTRHKWYGSASRIQRVIPIPRPKKSQKKM